VPGLKRLAEQRLAEISRNVIGQMAAPRGPLVWVLPEFNLGDWRDPITNAPYLLQETNWSWIQCYRKAADALARCDYQAASMLAAELLELDGGASNASFCVLAECAKKTG